MPHPALGPNGCPPLMAVARTGRPGARRKLDWSVEVGNEVQVSAIGDDPVSPARPGLTPEAAAQAAAYWPLPIARAVPAAVLALAITFSTGHSARFGSIAFGVFAVASGTIIAALAFRRLAAASARPFLIAQGIVTVVLGVLALVLQSGGLASFFLVVTTWAAITGALELYAGISSRRRFVASGDWTIVGAITLGAALVFLLLPPDIADEVTTADGGDRHPRLRGGRGRLARSLRCDHRGVPRHRRLLGALEQPGTPRQHPAGRPIRPGTVRPGTVGPRSDQFRADQFRFDRSPIRPPPTQTPERMPREFRASPRPGRSEGPARSVGRYGCRRI